jgi:hypothetical protein
VSRARNALATNICPKSVLKILQESAPSVNHAALASMNIHPVGIERIESARVVSLVSHMSLRRKIAKVHWIEGASNVAIVHLEHT